MGLGPVSGRGEDVARFEHPNVVRVRDCFEANTTTYIVMDYEDSEPLDALLQRHGALTKAQLKRVLLPVADGLRQVHAAGFLHRDIKPVNIYVRRSKDIENRRKHGLGFEDAKTAFADVFGRVIADLDHSHGEERFVLLGMNANQLLVVCHCEVEPDVIRIVHGAMEILTFGLRRLSMIQSDIADTDARVSP